MFSRIAQACQVNFGTAFDRFIECLIRSRGDLKETVAERMEEFLRQVRADLDDDLTSDVAKKFALIYAGGSLAIKFGILPWEDCILFDAIRKYFHAAIRELPTDRAALENGIVALRAYLDSLPKLLANRPRSLKFDDIEGFGTSGWGDHYYLVKCDAFNSIFTSVEQRRLVTDWLIENCLVRLARGQTHKDSVRPVQAQFMWPDGDRRRSYQITWPDLVSKPNDPSDD